MLLDLFDSIIGFVLDFVSSLGYFGIFILMTIESTIIPFPMEIILVPAGALAAQGEMSFVLILIAAILGSVAGALINYYLAYFIGRRGLNKLVHKYGKFVFMYEDSVVKSEKYFDKHGDVTTFVGRLIPGVRSFVSLPAGFAKMNLLRFMFYTGLGAGIWSAILIYLGYLFGDNIELIRNNLTSLTLVVVAFCLIVVLVYLLIWKKKKK